MEHFQFVRALLAWATEHSAASDRLGKDVLDWSQTNCAQALGLSRTDTRKLNWTGLKRAVRRDRAPDGDVPAYLRLAQSLAGLLDLDETDTRIIGAIFAVHRDPLVADLSEMLSGYRVDNFKAVRIMAGLGAVEGERRIRANPLIAYNLLEFDSGSRGQMNFYLRWSLEQLIDRMPSDESGVIEALIGQRDAATLPVDAFAHVAQFDFLQRLLRGAVRERAKGINILVHGPPGTGKTELARSLAREAGLASYGVGESTIAFDEPNRADRVGALRLGHALLGKRANSVMVFDEMEDLSGDAEKLSGGRMRGRSGSKVFVNRLLETGDVPVIWTTNDIYALDPAVLRRMSFILHMDYPPRSVARRIVTHVSAEEGVTPSGDVLAMCGNVRETPTVARVAARASRLAGDADGGAQAAISLVRGLRGGELPHPSADAVDLSLYEADRSIGDLCETLAAQDASDISILLTGPPGTGKTALAHHFANMLDRPLTVKRGSDLLSKWVGETEARIAQAFERARADNAVLFFDEADSLLFDRADARATWETGQVNELLSWLDRHPLPVIAATNFESRLDPATKRRFVYKLALRSLGPESAARAYRRFFDRAAPAGLRALDRLTPGDFSVVARQLRHEGDLTDEAILQRLAQEVAAKGGGQARMGF